MQLYTAVIMASGVLILLATILFAQRGPAVASRPSIGAGLMALLIAAAVIALGLYMPQLHRHIASVAALAIAPAFWGAAQLIRGLRASSDTGHAHD